MTNSTLAGPARNQNAIAELKAGVPAVDKLRTLTCMLGAFATEVDEASASLREAMDQRH